MVIGVSEIIDSIMRFMLFSDMKCGSEPLFILSYDKFGYWWHRSLTTFGLGIFQWRNLVLRRNGITWRIERGDNYESVRNFGRWECEQSARKCIRIVVVACNRLHQSIDKKNWERLGLLCKSDAFVFDVCDGFLNT